MFDALPSNARAFHDQILQRSLWALKVNRHNDNFDAQRFNTGGQDLSRTFDVSRHAFFFEWFSKVHPYLHEAWSLLADDESRRLYLYLIAYRLGGHLSVRLPVAFRDPAKHAEFKLLQGGTPSNLDLQGRFGGLSHFDFSHEGTRYVVDCRTMEYSLYRRQYYLARGDIRVQPELGEHVIDAGACFGDTAVVFSESVGPEGCVYSFDPVADHLEVLSHNIAQARLKNIRAMPWGLSDKDAEAPPVRLERYDAGFRSSSMAVPLRTIDGLVNTGDLERVDFIKLDIEGAELEALRGAANTIDRFRPKLAISLYHKPNDIFEIALYLRARHPFYTFHLGHYTIHHEETILYGLPSRV